PARAEMGFALTRPPPDSSGMGIVVDALAYMAARRRLADALSRPRAARRRRGDEIEMVEVIAGQQGTDDSCGRTPDVARPGASEETYRMVSNDDGIYHSSPAWCSNMSAA